MQINYLDSSRSSRKGKVFVRTMFIEMSPVLWWSWPWLVLLIVSALFLCVWCVSVLCSLLISIHDQHTSGLPMRICCITLEYCITPLSSVWKKANHQSNQRLEPLPQWWIRQFKNIHFLFRLVISSMNMAICFDRYIYSTFEHKIFNCMIGISD